MFVFLLSCKNENQTFISKNKIENTTIDLTDNFSVIVNYDTITAPKAPKRITRNIKLDSEGNLLIAAYDDIIRFNGNSFTHLEKEEGLDSWYAFDVLEDKKGDIWIASDQSGAYRINVSTGTITNFTTNDGLGHKRNMCIYEDKAGNIWIGGQGGLSRFNGNEFINFTTEDGLPHNDINTILEDKTGNIWFGTRGNAGLYDGKFFHEIKNDEGKFFFNVWSITEDNTGNIWLVDSSGLWKHNQGTFTHELPDVWKIYEDTKGDFWNTGMLKGGGSVLKRIESKSMADKKSIATEIFKSDKMFFGIVEDKKGNIWIGGGDGIWLYNGKIVNYFTGVITHAE
jgi:ligand-binding sensor domain-containing protein